MDFFAAFKIWTKAFALFVAGFLVLVYALSIMEFVYERLKGSVVYPHIINITIVSVVVGGGFFLIYWGWFCFRSKLPFGSVQWLVNLAAGFATLALIALAGLLLQMLGVLALSPILCRIALLVIPVLLVSETVALIVKIKARNAVQLAKEAEQVDASPSV